MNNALLNATIILVMEMNSDCSPKINFKGSEVKKSFSAYLEIRIDKKTSFEDEANISVVASDTANIINAGFFKQSGIPVLLSQTGMLNAAERTPVAMTVEINIQELAVHSIQDFTFFSSSWCSTLNNSLGVIPEEFFFSMYDGCITFFTSC
ncbi:hypothetical protein L6164_017513 [Bauhinia variegata]|uniref:Uncharacterized protein n=1 Tax=Bauhinia variegata TaxID=167791 RepID=A0ACB9NA28_BAUVA|nr:hypothetical protein L6164_017513 [Bauhinia variegata]